jgi:hypothetical protein
MFHTPLQSTEQTLQVLMPSFTPGLGVTPAALRVSGCSVNVAPVRLPPFQVYDIPDPVTQLPRSAGVASNNTVRSWDRHVS